MDICRHFGQDLLAAEQQIADQLSEILSLQKSLAAAHARIAVLEAAVPGPLEMTPKGNRATDSKTIALLKPLASYMDSSLERHSSPSRPLKRLKHEDVEFSEPASLSLETAPPPFLLLDSGPQSLISCKQLIKDEFPKGTLVGLTKAQSERINEAVKEFLAEKGLSPELIGQCVVHEGLKVKKPVAAIPHHLIGDFPEWLIDKLDAGMLHLRNLKKRLDKRDAVSILIMNRLWQNIR
jgi:hypothetical protein